MPKKKEDRIGIQLETIVEQTRRLRQSIAKLEKMLEEEQAARAQKSDRHQEDQSG